LLDASANTVVVPALLLDASANTVVVPTLTRKWDPSWARGSS
jgi:hypothetical protein